MDWANEFLERCLSGLPDGRCRDRVRGELADHLALLVRDLTGAGLSEGEARAEALKKMGDPEKLKQEYATAWERRAHPLWDFGLCVLGGMVALVSLVFISIFLGALGFTYDAQYLNRTSIPILSSPYLMALFGWLLYAGTYIPNAAFLRLVFGKRRRTRALISAGLVMTWVVETSAIILLSASIYGMPLSDLPALLHRISRGGDVTAPWFTIPYIVSSFGACLALGWLFGWKRPGRAEKETA